jgi:acetoin:2,6-dichlorophenolindophenol oxidoreductase subunit beta
MRMSTPTETAAVSSTQTFADAIRAAIADEMRVDANVFLMGEDVAARGGVFNVTEGLLAEFGEERVRDTPISEAAITAAAIGAAIGGMRPVLEIMFNDFLPLALDQLVNEAAKLHYMTGGQIHVPVTVRTTYGTARSAAAHHSQTLYAWLCHVPGLKVVAPSNPLDAYGLLRASIRDESPVVFFEDKVLYQQSTSEPFQQRAEHRLGVGNVVRLGRDVTVVALGRFVEMAIAVADELAPDLEVEIIDPRTLFPLDDELLVSSAKKTRRVIIIESGVRRFGLTAELAARIYEGAFDFLDAPVERLAAREVVIPFSPALEPEVLPEQDDLRAAIIGLIGK